MYIVHHTLRLAAGNKETFTDNYQLADTIKEGQQIVQNLISIHGDDLYCYSLAEVLEASEPHWVKKNHDNASTLSGDAWGTDR